MQNKKYFTFFLVCATVCILGFDVAADVVELTNGGVVKGYIVEKTGDSCLLQTALGTVDFSLDNVKHIKYEAPEESLSYLAQEYLTDNKFEEAISYYEKALEKNPDFKQAKNGLKEAKRCFEKYQRQQEKIKREELALKSQLQDSLKEDYGLGVEKSIEGLKVFYAAPEGRGAQKGLASNDIIIALDEIDLRDINENEAYNLLIESFDKVKRIYICRQYFIEPSQVRVNFKDRKALGIILTKKNNYIEVDDVIENSPAETAGIKKQDKLIKLNDIDVKNLKLKTIATIAKKSDKINLVIIRCLKMEEQKSNGF
jgi:S1-C subfamily serine protease